MDKRESAINNFIEKATSFIIETGQIGVETDKSGNYLLDGKYLIKEAEFNAIISTAFNNAINSK